MPFIIFIFGLIVGSFLNVTILRYETGESIFKGKSRCFNCGKNLRWRELIPLVSFLIQKGRCKNCESKISVQYPLVELLTGIIFLLVAAKIFNPEGVPPLAGPYGASFQFLIPLFYYWTIFSFLIIISVYDIRHQIIPDKFVYSLIIMSLFSYFFQVSSSKFQVPSLTFNILSGFAMFSFFALLWLVSRGKWMGFGDAKLALGIGFLLGPTKAILAFLFSFWFGAIFGIILLIFSRGKVSFKSSIPFGPFLSLSAFLAFLFEASFF